MVAAVAGSFFTAAQRPRTFSRTADTSRGSPMRGFKTLLSVSALFASAVLVSGSLAPAANAQVVISVQPNCPYGYYDYAPYACSPMGYYGSGYFYNGIFLGMGPWSGWGYNHGWGGHRFSGEAADAITAAAEWAANRGFSGGGGRGAMHGGGGGHAMAAHGGGGGSHAMAAHGGGGAQHGGGGPHGGGGGGQHGGGGGQHGGGGSHGGGGGGHR